MIRRKAREYSGSSLELGGTSEFTKHVPMKKLGSMKSVKYIILIALGFLLHSGYRFLTKPNSEREIIDITPEDLVNGEAIDDLKNRWDDEDNEFAEERDPNVKAKLSDHAKKVFENHNSKNVKSVKIEKETKKAKIVRNSEEVKKQNEDIKKQNEGVALDSIAKQLRESSHLNKQIKDSVVDVKFHPKNDLERKDLKNEMEIENRIAELMDDKGDSQKADQMAVEDYNDPQKPVLRDPKIQQEFQQKAEQIAKVVHSQSVVLSEGHHSHDIPAFVTAVSQQTITQVEHLVASIQYFYPRESIYIFDLDLNDHQRKKMSSLCNVHMRGFWLNLFPSFIHDLSNFHWRPLIIQTALAEFAHITWINPGFKVSSTAFSELVHRSEEPGILVMGQSADYSTFAVTHPKMYKYLSVDRTELFKSPHIEMRAMIIHNTDVVMNNFMKILTACAIEERCLSPVGATPDCSFDVTGREYANCHRHDESAINIILKNWLGHKPVNYLVKSNFLQPINKLDKANPKFCKE